MNDPLHEHKVLGDLDKLALDVRRIAVALEALLNVAEWYTSGDTTTLDALANKLDDLERRIMALEAPGG